ncbi:MAG: hypothetical protein F4Z78_15255 [Gammaproteobacteria bacterium]|nr:hypothetical protein [Gammaproteobacteria bacterium]
MSKNQYSATTILVASAVALLAAGCDDGGFLAPPGGPYGVESVAALDPESPERWEAEYDRLLAENPDVLQLHRSWFDDNDEPSEFFRTWEPPAQRSRCRNGRIAEQTAAAVVETLRARTEGGATPTEQLAGALDAYIRFYGAEL